MQLELTRDELLITVEAIDVVTKTYGIRVIYTSVALLEALNAPETEEIAPFEITEEIAKQLLAFFDLAVKAVGLNGGAEHILPIAAKVRAALTTIEPK